MARIDVEHLIPFTNDSSLGQPAYFNLMAAQDERSVASAVAILLARNAGGARDIYKERNVVGITDEHGRKFKVIVVEMN